MAKGGAYVLGSLASLFALFAISGSSSARERPGRAIRNGPIDPPGGDNGWAAVDEALCLCFEVGTPAAQLSRCVFERLYPEVVFPLTPGSDHPSVGVAWSRVRMRAASFLLAVQRGENPCGLPAPVPAPEQPPEIDNPFSDGAEVGRFARIVAGSNPTRVVRSAMGFAANDARINAALRCIAGTGWNLYFYSRRHNADAYGRVRVGARYYDIGPAWLPGNRDIRVAWENGTRPIRNVSWSGVPVSAGVYGSPWVPDMTLSNGVLVCPGDDPWDPRRNPPAEVLARLGHNLETMRDVWESNNG